MIHATFAKEARFTCRFPAHALAVSEKLAEAARARGISTSTSQGRLHCEIHFEGEIEQMRQFTNAIGIRTPDALLWAE